jgi:hypothetical protein
MPGNKRQIEDVLASLNFTTDYPIIISNDDYYGGLGGRYAITTRSRNSGAMVLRHELGHNFSDVGEEYDGGQVYSGANFSSSNNLKWSHWIDGEIKTYNAINIKNEYVWQNLSDESFSSVFTIPNDDNYTFEMKISSVGWEDSNAVKVTVDSREVDLEGVFTRDRSFMNMKNVNISSGKHKISIEDNSKDGDNVLAYVKSYAYPSNYNFTPYFIAGFNVFDTNGIQRGYRPTHNQCLMRNMRSKIFCPIDQENIWLKFLGRINLIESVSQQDEYIEIVTIPVGHVDTKWFRKKGWRGFEEIEAQRGKLRVQKTHLGDGKFKVQTIFSHPEIRKSDKNLTDEREFELGQKI